MLYVGIDVGASYVRAGLFDASGSVIKKLKRQFPSTDFEGFLKRLILDLCSEQIREVSRVGIGSIGPLDIARGSVVKTPNAPIKSFNLVEPVRELGLEVVVANDASAAAWGEHVLGLGKGRENMLYITISTGIGGGAIVDGELLVGKEGNAHEIGHIVVDYSSSLRCGCGGYGHWEAIASGANIPRSFIEYVEARALCRREETIDSPLCRAVETGRAPQPGEIFSQYYKGDPVASAYVEDYLVPVNAAGIASAINAYDPELVVIGGGVALNNRGVFVKAVEHLERYLAVSRPEAAFTAFEDDVGIYGAAALAIRPPRSLRKYIEMWNSRS